MAYIKILMNWSLPVRLDVVMYIYKLEKYLKTVRGPRVGELCNQSFDSTTNFTRQ